MSVNPTGDTLVTRDQSDPENRPGSATPSLSRVDSEGLSRRAASPRRSGAFRLFLHPLPAGLRALRQQEGAAASGGGVRASLQGPAQVRLRGAYAPFQPQPSVLLSEREHSGKRATAARGSAGHAR